MQPPEFNINRVLNPTTGGGPPPLSCKPLSPSTMVPSPNLRLISLTVLVTLCSNLSSSLDCGFLTSMKSVWCLSIPRPVSGLEGPEGCPPPQLPRHSIGRAQEGRTESGGLSWGMLNGFAGALPRDPSWGFGMC